MALIDGDDESTPRPVGRPRLYDDDKERELIFSAAYRALRDRGADVTIAKILHEAGVSTRSFYRHFPSKDALLCAMYRRDAQSATKHIVGRLTGAKSAVQAVEWWIDEIFGMVSDARRAERAAVLGSITTGTTSGANDEAAQARALLVAPLATAIHEGAVAGSFTVDDPASAADLTAAAVMHAAGLNPMRSIVAHDQATVTRFCLAALTG